ncbi:MAG: glycoside hydrolase family 9 protein, partial [Bacteroidota bacterium]|nr:glycoside hydrolase family 9 protein [Bacteroidota bacterium]
NSCLPDRESNEDFQVPEEDFIAEEMTENPFGDGWTIRKDLPGYSDLGSGAIIAGVFQNEKQLRIAFNLVDNPVSGSEKGNYTLSFNPMYFFVAGMPVLVDPDTEKKRDIDYVFKNERLFFNVKAEKHLQYIEINAVSRKLKNLGELTMEDKIKQARMIRRIRQKIDSWSPLASGQIIAQPTLRPIISHGGYAVDGSKKAVIWSNSTKITGTFELLDALNNRQHPDAQPVVYSGNLEEVGNHIWGGNNYIADFSDFTKEGLYFLRAKVNETNEVTDSYVFNIRKNLYLDLAVKASRWFNYQRCGTEVPGFHKECHMEDAVINLDGKKIDVTGGWHDAGDYGKWVAAGARGVLALLALQDEFGDELKSSSGIPEFVDEAAWEAEYFCKTFWNAHFYPGFTANHENVVEWLGAPENEPPRIANEAEILEDEYPLYTVPGLSLIGSSLAMAGRQISPFDKELSEKCISIAKEVRDLEKDVKLEGKYLNSFLSLQSGLLNNDIELYKFTKDKKYKKSAQKRVKNILKLQDNEGYFYMDEERTSSKYEICDYQLPPLYEFLKLYPEDELNIEIKNAFKRWADYVLQFVKVSNFGIIGGKAEDGSLRNLYERNFRNRATGMNAWGLATAAILLNDLEYLKAAENQLQWIVGFNPADISMMADVGKGPGCYHHRYCFMEGCEDGVV